MPGTQQEHSEALHTSSNRRQFLWGLGAASALGITGITSPVVASKDGTPASGEGIVWPRNQALPRFRRAKHLDVLDIRELDFDKLLLTTLQGIINRKRPRLYLLSDFEEGPFTWLNDLNIDYTVHNTQKEVESVVQRYVGEADLVIAYDPDVPASINVGTTIAGVENGVVTDYTRATELVSEHDHLELRDLRDKFEGPQDAYQWQFENYWAKTSNRHIVGLRGGSDVPVADIPIERQDYYDVLLSEDKQLRDGSNRDVYELDLSPYLGDDAIYLRFDDAFEDDGWGPAVYSIRLKTGDGNTVADFKPTTKAEDAFLYDPDGSQTKEDLQLRFADGTSYFIYKFEPPKAATELTAYVDVENQYEIAATNTSPPDPSKTEFKPFTHNRDYAVATRAFTLWPSGNIQDLFSEVLETRNE